jgi:phosphatidylglycerol:prolipoprotein diacylglycerol transferase
MRPELEVLGFSIDSYRLFYALAAVVAGVLLGAGLRRRGHSGWLAALLLSVALAAGFVGGKLYYVLQAPGDVDLTSVGTWVGFTGTGWYGALALGSLSVLLTLRLLHLPLLDTLDLLAPIVPLSQAVGRIGCLLAGCCRGSPSDLPWAVTYATGWPRQAHPAPLYEAFLYVCVAAFLWSLRSVRIRPGGLFGLYLVLAGLGRFVVEFYRLNPKVALDLTAPQLVAAFAIMVGVVLMSRSHGDHRGGADSIGAVRGEIEPPRD